MLFEQRGTNNAMLAEKEIWKPDAIESGGTVSCLTRGVDHAILLALCDQQRAVIRTAIKHVPLRVPRGVSGRARTNAACISSNYRAGDCFMGPLIQS